jgi:hypothetical protein
VERQRLEKKRFQGGDCCDDFHPYRRATFLFESATGTWRAMQKIGDSCACMAQAWGIVTEPGKFSVVGGYGLVNSTEITNEKTGKHWQPDILVASYDCVIQEAEPKRSSADCWAVSSPLIYFRERFEDAYSPIAATSESELLSGQFRLESILHMWFDKGKRYQDSYYGPISAKLANRFLEVGWNDNTAVLSRPRYRGVNFPSSLHEKLSKAHADHKDVSNVYNVYRVLNSVQDEQERVDGPIAAHYAERMACESRQDIEYVTVRIEIESLMPCIFREVRVRAGLTLAHLHDFVICPVFGYVRNYHAYAFRRENDPWLGPVTSTAMDMAHVPFYIGALGDDRKIRISALLSKLDDCITYVFDLGDWWQHKITVTAVDDASGVHRSTNRIFASAELLSGSMQGPPMDIGGPQEYLGKVNRLIGVVDDPDTLLKPQCLPLSNTLENTAAARRPLTPADSKWWALLNAEFRQKKNCTSIVFAPLTFDIEAARKQLEIALRSSYAKPKRASQSYTSYNGERCMQMDLDINSVSVSRTAKAVCVVCGSAAALKKCAGCNDVSYCSKAHQKLHWKTHKYECQRASVIEKSVHK